MKILVVAAHPDDEVLGCGATLAKWQKAGHEVQVMILGEGITSRGSDDAEEKKKALYETAAKAHKILGLGVPDIHHFPDNRFDSVALLDIIKVIEEKIQQFQPERVLTHFAGDLNIDHSLTQRAVLTATRPVPGQSVKEIWAFEVNSSSEWAFGQGHHFIPQIFEEVKDTIALKCEAMAAYEGEARPWPHPRSVRALESLAACRGSTAGVEAAEAFVLVRKIS